jgi:hypothetical protein
MISRPVPPSLSLLMRLKWILLLFGKFAWVDGYLDSSKATRELLRVAAAAVVMFQRIA